MSLFFFFKQKTAYEMRISDWSSDVCSSDLQACGRIGEAQQGVDARLSGRSEAGNAAEMGGVAGNRQQEIMRKALVGALQQEMRVAQPVRQPEIGRASCRERVCQYG